MTRGLMKADGFDDAIIGVTYCEGIAKIVYSKSKMIDILVQDQNLQVIDAIDYLEFNTWNAYIGEETPIYIDEMNYPDICLLQNEIE
jgi:hypothetical protein